MNNQLVWIAIALLFMLVPNLLLYGQTATYPLRLNDEWSWFSLWDNAYTTCRNEKDSLLPNGKVYSYMSGSSLVIPFPFQRQQGDSIFQYVPQMNEEVLFFNFSLSPGDTVSVFPYSNLWGSDSDTMTIWFKGITWANVLGHVRKQWLFTLEAWRSGTDALIDYVVTDSLGVTDRACFCSPIELKGAFINGVRYGEFTSVQEDLLPRSRILQNYPNPFNPSTTISFIISKYGLVKLQIFDPLGQMVQTLINEYRYPNSYTVDWDAKDKPSGIYFYRLTTSNIVQTGKAILLK